MVAKSQFEKKDIEKEKRVVLEEIELSKQDLEDIAFDKLCRLIFKETPLKDPVLGYKETIERFNEKLVKDRHKKFYSNFIVLYSSKEKLRNNRLPQNKLEINPPYIEPKTFKEKFFKLKTKKGNLLLWALIFKNNKDFKKRTVIDIFSYILGNMDSSILFKELVINGLVYKYHTEVVEYNGCSLVLNYIYSQKIDLVKKIIEKISKNLNKITTPALFNIAKNYAEKVNEFFISNSSFVDLVGHNFCTFGELTEPRKVIRIIRNVNFGDLRKMFNKNLIDFCMIELI